MFKNYFTVALRNFWRNKIFSTINVIGLSIGISAALVIYLIVHFEFSFDKFENDSGHVYRIVTNMKMEGASSFYAGVPVPLADAVRNEVTGVEKVICFQQLRSATDVVVEKKGGTKPGIYRNQDNIIFADDAYFSMISYQWLAGSPQTLHEPYKVVLSEERARAYFPGIDYESIIGKRIVYFDSLTVAVSGVVKDLAENTDFIFKEFISLATIPDSWVKKSYEWNQWQSINSNSQLFVKLSPGSSVKNIELQLKVLLKKYNASANYNNKNTTDFVLQPLSDLHFNAVYGTFGDHVADKPTLYGMLAVAAFLLLLGCINFINLTTAKATQRAKEIGIRKTMGSSRWQLLLQFLNETFFTAIVATVLSLVFVPVLLKIFSNFIPAGLTFDLQHQPYMIFFLVSLTIAVGFLAGFYPALVLSSYKPTAVLKNQSYLVKGKTRTVLVRRSLTVFQFFIAQVFLITTIVTVKQIDFVLNKDLGFKKDAIIFFKVPQRDKQDALVNELRAMPGIKLVSKGQAPPSDAWPSSGSMIYTDGKKNIRTIVQQKSGDTNYLGLYHIKLLAGRNVQQNDSVKEYIINETYMRALGFQNPRDVLNKNISAVPVVGVIADFNQQSLYEPIKSLAFGYQKNMRTVHIAMMPENASGQSWQATIGKIRNVFKRMYPDNDFQFQFFDESIAKLYKSEQDISSLLKWATAIAVFISCIGLLGLVIYTTNIRTKEIGVRKVLGASVSDIVTTLSGDFLILIGIAFVIAVPVAWVAMHRWLENFAYRTSVTWWLFAGSGLIMMMIALITLSFQVIAAANENPVKSLRSE